MSLAVICVGLAIYVLPKLLTLDTASLSGTADPVVVGVTFGLTISVISAIASITTELLMKGDTPFWVAQVRSHVCFRATPVTRSQQALRSSRC